MIERLERLFPHLAGTAYRITSPPTDSCNCIAWAAGLTSGWWWPVGNPRRISWPEGITREETVRAFRAVFVMLGYAPCDDERLESGFEKVALFADAAGIPTHAARQLPTGPWTSKLGLSEDIEHVLRTLEGEIYGTVVLVMKRPLPTAPTAPSEVS